MHDRARNPNEPTVTRASRPCHGAHFLGLMLLAMLLGAGPAENPIFPRPTVVPVPDLVAGVSNAVIPISAWKTTSNPQGQFWSNNTDLSAWTDAQVGGRGGRGGRGGARGGRGGRGGQVGGEFTTAYKSQISIPADWAGKRAIVRFDAVAYAAKLWVNGTEIRTHWGSLMPFTADITDHVKPGEDAWVTLGVDERGTGLGAFMRGGGLQRNVTLFAAPANYINRLRVETDFDEQYRDATLKIFAGMSINGAKTATVRLALKDSQGKAVELTPASFELTSDMILQTLVRNPRQWDAEHPNLYTLDVSVVAGDTVTQTLSRTIGLREVEVRGNRMFVNGKEIKLRGIWGMNSVAQLKQLNANHTRQKWVTEQFLADADRLGMYVLDETPIDFAKYGPESDPDLAYQWVGLMADLVERDFNHPSVIMWGIGNESLHGENVLKAFKYTQAEDAQRPIMQSWANRVPVNEELPYTVYSSHYPDLNDPKLDLGGYTVAKWHSPSLPEQRSPRPVMPVIHDEYSHVVLNQEYTQRDPNVRNFWGESIYRYWEKMMVTPGALGGDIFGLGGGFNAGATESYLTRKAYSPVRIANQPLGNPGAGKAMEIPIKNWFDHTNLKELTVAWTIGDEKGSMNGPDVAPHAAGSLQLPARAWKDGEKLSLTFSLADGTVIDEFNLAINPPAERLPQPQGPAPKLEQSGKQILITGEKFKIVFDKFKGLISDASYDGKTVLIDGPYLDLLGSGLAYGEWWCDKISAKMDGNEAVVDIAGNYAVIAASFQVRIDGQGLITTKYTIDHVPGGPPPITYSPWNATSNGGYEEVGVSYMLPSGVDSLEWRRKALWSAYPDDHIGRPQGKANATSDEFRATKESIYIATATVNGATATALSDGRDSVRLSQDAGYRVLPGGVRFGIHNEWNYPAIGLGNYTKPPINIGNGYSNTVYLKLGASRP